MQEYIQAMFDLTSLDLTSLERYYLEAHPYDITCFCYECDRLRAKQLSRYWYADIDEKYHVKHSVQQIYENNAEEGAN